MRSVPAPVILAPIAMRHSARSTDFRFARRILERRYPVGERRCHHQVFRAGDRHQVEDELGSDQALRLGIDIAVIEVDFGAHRHQALNMLIDRSQADRTSAGQGNTRLATAREQWAERQDRRPHGLDHLIGGKWPVDGRGAKRKRSVLPLGIYAHLAEERLHRTHVVQARHIGQRHRLRRQQRSAKNRQRGILGARNLDLSVEPCAAINEQSIHSRFGASCRHSAGVSVIIDSAWISSRIRSPNAAYTR